MDGEYRVAQYGQWDGYPEGQGLTCLRFLRDQMNEKDFRDALSQIKYIDAEKLQRMWLDYGMYEDGSIKISDADRFRKAYPEFSRDTGAEILTMIQNNRIQSNSLEDCLIFAAESLFCEWAYVVDFDRRTFEVYMGFNKTPLNESDRFFFLREYEDPDEYSGGVYHGVKLVREFDLDNLPDDEMFLAAFKEEGDEDEKP
jgi:hypothetical protein